MIAYMVTCTTYGSWLQGDEKGYVQDGQILPGSCNLLSANQKQQKQNAVKLNLTQKQIVEDAIKNEAIRIGQKLYAISVCSNHVHLLLEVSKETIEKAVQRYKYSATALLRNSGLKGNIWTRGFDKRFCFTENDIAQKIRYIQRHKS